MLAAGPVDLLVTDLGLPGESGVDLLRSLAADDRPATLVLTGSDDQDAVRSSLDLGAFAYLTKPPTLGGLQIAAVGALRQKDLETMHRSTIARLRDEVAQRSAARARRAARRWRTRSASSRERSRAATSSPATTSTA